MERMIVVIAEDQAPDRLAPHAGREWNARPDGGSELLMSYPEAEAFAAEWRACSWSVWDDEHEVTWSGESFEAEWNDAGSVLRCSFRYATGVDAAGEAPPEGVEHHPEDDLALLDQAEPIAPPLPEPPPRVRSSVPVRGRIAPPADLAGGCWRWVPAGEVPPTVADVELVRTALRLAVMHITDEGLDALGDVPDDVTGDLLADRFVELARSYRSAEDMLASIYGPDAPRCEGCGLPFAPSEARAGFATCERCPRP